MLFLLPFLCGGVVLGTAIYDQVDKEARSKQKALPPPFYDECAHDLQLHYQGKTYKLFTLFGQDLGPLDDEGFRQSFEDFAVYQYTVPGSLISESSFFCVYRKVIKHEVVDYCNHGFVDKKQFKELTRKYASRTGWAPLYDFSCLTDDDGNPTTMTLV